MADTKISALTAASTLGGTEALAGVQSAANVKITPAQIKTYAESNPIALAPPSLTGSAATTSLDITQTWNTTGTPTALSVAVTDTASNAASLLFNATVGGTSKFSISKSGFIAVPSSGAAATVAAWGSGANGFAFQTGFGFNAGLDNIHVTRPDNTYMFGATITTFAVRGNIAIGATANNAGDLFLARDAANTLALRNSTNAQAFNVYQSYTDASNYTRAKLSAASSIVTLAAESAGTGDANVDIAITPKGSGVVKMGTHSAIAAETVTGYITIKDAGGTSRKLAVVS